jgi:hypothetical protein
VSLSRAPSLGVTLALTLLLAVPARAQSPSDPPPVDLVVPVGEPTPTLDAVSASPEAVDLTTLPTGRGLPVVVHVGVVVVQLGSVDENEDAFEATIDLRTTWSDPRLGYAAEEAPGGMRRFRGDEVAARLAEMWAPDTRLANLEGEPSHQVRGLRIAPNGDVELLERTTARFLTHFDVTRFPFDRQRLAIELLSERDPRDLVSLVFRQDDLDFTRVAPGVAADGWTARFVSLDREVVRGWHGESHDSVRASLEVQRWAGQSAAPIFIPLLASLLIPLLAMWLNRYEDGEFKIEAFELANVIVGGLFAVIALNFTVNSALATLGTGDNTVTRLFSLNYLTLAVSLLINLLMFRYRVVGKRFGRFVEEQVFLFATWAVPLLAVASAVAFVLVAYA